MIKIRAIITRCADIDETGAPVVKDVIMPQTPIPANAVSVECDGQFYTVYEQGD